MLFSGFFLNSVGAKQRHIIGCPVAYLLVPLEMSFYHSTDNVNKHIFSLIYKVDLLICLQNMQLSKSIKPIASEHSKLTILIKLCSTDGKYVNITLKK